MEQIEEEPEKMVHMHVKTHKGVEFIKTDKK